MDTEEREPVFDEEVALRRFQVALRRGDERLFLAALDRLNQELRAGAKFGREQDWLDCVRQVEVQPRLSVELKERLRGSVARMMGVTAPIMPRPLPLPRAEDLVSAPSAPAVAPAPSGEAPVNEGDEDEQAPGQTAPEQVTPGPSADGPLGVFALWLREREPSAARALLQRWLAEGATLDELHRRARLTLEARANGLSVNDPMWLDVFYAGAGSQGLLACTRGCRPFVQPGALVAVCPVCGDPAWPQQKGLPQPQQPPPGKKKR